MSRRPRVPNAPMVCMAPVRATVEERYRWKAAAERHGISLAEVARWAWEALDRGELEVRTTTVSIVNVKPAKNRT